jgi:hypothetical protein
VGRRIYPDICRSPYNRPHEVVLKLWLRKYPVRPETIDVAVAARHSTGDPSRASALVVRAQDGLAKANLEDESPRKRWESNNKILTRLLVELRST